MTQVERRSMWQQRVAQYSASGQSVAAWCREHAVSEHQMRYWLRRLRNDGAAGETVDQPGALRWIQVGWGDMPGQDAVGSGKASPILIHIGEVAIEVRPGFSPPVLRDVVKVLLTPC